MACEGFIVLAPALGYAIRIVKNLSDSDPISAATCADNAPDNNAPDDPLEGTVIADRYLIQQLLGQGAMGAVYRAEHVHMRKTVAVKVLHAQMTAVPEVVARFEREAIAAGSINHPHVAAATDFGRLDNGSFYLVLEYAQGHDLRNDLNQHGALPVHRCVHIAHQIAQALAAAHAKGVIHRDLKPENIMLVQRDHDTDFVKVLDFGIAKLNTQESTPLQPLTQIGAVFGTPAYMSPEQAVGKEVDLRTDLYSLGILMYEMLTGAVPFDSNDAAEVLYHHLSLAPAPLHEQIPSEIRQVVDRLLAKKPADRPSSATEVASLLHSFLQHSFLQNHAAATPSTLVAFTNAAVDAFTNTELASHNPHPNATASAPHAPPSPLRRLWNHLQKALRAVANQGRKWLEKYLPFVFRSVSVGPIRLPVGAVLVGGFAAMALALVIVVVLSAQSSANTQVQTLSRNAMPSFSQYPLPSGVGTVRPPSLVVQAVESIAVAQRSADDWLELARGYANAGRAHDSASAYRAVLQLDRKRAQDPGFLYALRVLAKHPNAYPVVLHLTEAKRKGLGSTGPELLWDIWNDQVQASDPAAETSLKKLVIMSARSSRSLRVAVELNAATSCYKLEFVLRGGLKYIDERSRARLTYIQSKTNCVDRGCFSCLKHSKLLADAIERANNVKAPSIQNAYRL